MPMDGIMLGFVQRELHSALLGGRVDKVSQPEGDTVVLLIRSNNENFKLLLCSSANNARCHLTRLNFQNPPEPPVFCMLLRKHLLGARVKDIRQIDGDRQIHFVFEAMDELGVKSDKTLVLEVMGRHSNLILVNAEGRIIDSCRRVNAEMSRVREVLPGLPYLSPPKQDKWPPEMITKAMAAEKLAPYGDDLAKGLMQFVSGLSKPAANEWAYRLMQGANLVNFIKELPAMGPPVVLWSAGGLALDVFPFLYESHDTAHQKPYDTPSIALETFFASRDASDRVSQKTAAISRTLKNHIERNEKKLALQNEELQAAEQMENYRIMGELITANLHQIKKGQELVTLYNYYDEAGGSLPISLDKQLTPSQNAQRYYKRYQKARSAREGAKEQKENTLKELAILEAAYEDLRKCEDDKDIADIRAELERTGYLRALTKKGMKRKPEVSRPLCYLSEDGIRILVGKNALQNERITGDARGDEMWLHAKDMPGSHVVIKYEGMPPEKTLEAAAQLASFYSKGREAPLNPVDYTFRKHVKKPGGSPTGFVIYTHQKTAYMTVTQEDILKIKEAEA